MSGWFRKSIPCRGSVYFPGSLPPRAKEFAFLRQAGMELALRTQPEERAWRLRLKHPEWGEAELACDIEPRPIPEIIVKLDPRLTEAERAEARMGGTQVILQMDAQAGHVLRDRKRFLRFLRAVMGSDGVVAVDAAAQGFWTRASLDEELAHDADLDVTALYSIHAVQGPVGERVNWLHTHGLRHEGAAPARLRTHRRRSRLVRRLRPVRRFRPHFRRGQSQPQDPRNPHPLPRPNLRRQQHPPLPARPAPAAHEPRRASQAEAAVARRHARIASVRAATVRERTLSNRAADRSLEIALPYGRGSDVRRTRGA